MSAANNAANTASGLQAGIVRSVLSGDTLIVRPKGVATPGSERSIHIAGIAAPRMGSRDRDDEPQAFPSREHLRLLLVGREVRYKVEYTVPVPGTGGPGREFAHVYLPPKAPGLPDTNVAAEILTAGWAKVHDSNLRRNGPGSGGGPGGAGGLNGSSAAAAAAAAAAQQQLMPEEDEEAGGWKAKLRQIQDEAQAAQRGIWGPDDSLIKVDYTMPEDTHAFLSEWKGKPIDSVVEQVRDGSMLRVRLFLTPKHHQLINLNLAGIKAPRVPAPGANPDSNSAFSQAEPYGEESKFFVESRLLQRNVKVTILSMPQPASVPTPFASTTAAAAQSAPPPPTATVLIGTALHPVGDIAQFLLSAGLARCVDWHAGILSAAGGMEKYRVAERTAKDKRIGIWKDYAPSASANAIAGQPNVKRTFEAVVGRIISGDTVHVFVDEDYAASSNGSAAGNKQGRLNERRIQLSSIRQALIKDPKQAGYANEAREFLRKRLIGKTVTVQIDYIKPKDGDFEERHYATIRSGGKETNIAELLVQRGLATVQRHKRDDEDRSPEYDRLMEAEAAAMSEQRGIHSGKELPAARMGDASDNAAKANSFLPGLKRAGRVPAVVDFVAAASRFKLIVPRENVRLTFVLAGIRAPRTARNPHEKDEAFGREGLEYTTRRALQRDVEVEFLTTDKAGGFIGNLFLNKSENLAVSLVGEGLASVHAYSAEGLSSGNALFEAERKAQAARLNLWKDFEGQVDGLTSNGHGADGASAATAGANGHASAGGAAASGGAKSGGAWGSSAKAGANEPAPARREYADVIISDVRGNGADVPFSFAVQILDDRISELETLMKELALQTSAPPPAANYVPRAGEVVCAKFSQDGAWYRAQVKKSQQAGRKAEVHYIDYGNIETVAFTDIRPLDAGRFGRTRLPAQAKEARLSFVKLFEGSADGKQSDYVLDAQDRFRDFCEGRKLIANIDFRENLGGGTGAAAAERLHLTLYDPSNPSVVGSPEACINVDLAREGYALPDEKVAYWKSYPALVKALEEANEEARRRHRGVFEYGDPTETNDGPAFRR